MGGGLRGGAGGLLVMAAGGGLQVAGGGLQAAGGGLLAWLGCSKRPNCGQRQQQERGMLTCLKIA